MARYIFHPRLPNLWEQKTKIILSVQYQQADCFPCPELLACDWKVLSACDITFVTSVSTFVIGCCELWSLWEIGNGVKAAWLELLVRCVVWGDEHLTNIWQTGLILSNIAQNQLWYIWISRFSIFCKVFNLPFIILWSFDVEIAKVFLGWIRMVGWKRMPIVLYAGAL